MLERHADSEAGVETAKAGWPSERYRTDGVALTRRMGWKVKWRK